jgi:hypothetical protein
MNIHAVFGFFVVKVLGPLLVLMGIAAGYGALHYLKNPYVGASVWYVAFWVIMFGITLIRADYVETHRHDYGL